MLICYIVLDPIISKNIAPLEFGKIGRLANVALEALLQGILFPDQFIIHYQLEKTGI